MTKPTVIDAHFHSWERSFPDRAYPWTPDPCQVHHVLGVFDANGVDGGFDVTPIMYGFDNDETMRACEPHRSRLGVFGRLDPTASPAKERLLQWMARPGAAGVRLTFYGDDRRLLEDADLLAPFWRAAEETGVRVAVFAPDDLWAIVRVMDAHPKLRLVIDHLGLGVYPGCDDPFRHHDAVERFAAYRQVLVKISGAIEVSRDPGGWHDVRELIEHAAETFGAARLLWGSNYPVVLSTCSYREALDLVDHCGFDDHDRQLVLGGTALTMIEETTGTTTMIEEATGTARAASEHDTAEIGRRS